MLQNYFRTTFRHILKNKVNFVLKLGGLALALFSFLVIALYVSHQRSYDRHHDDYQNIYRVNSERKENGKQEKYSIVPSALGTMLHEHFPEIAAFTRISGANSSHVRYKQAVIRCGVFPADSSLFDVFTFHFLKGQKDALKKPGSIVLTRSMAVKIFGAEDPLHKLISLNNQKRLFQVTAVIEDIPPTSHLVADAFISMTDNHDFSINSIVSPVEFVDHSAILYLRFREQANPDLFASKLETLLAKQISKKDLQESGFRVFLQPLADIYLDPPFKYEFTKKGSTLYLRIFSALGVFLLAVASINYINLSIADFSSRSREIGIRKVMGARKIQIAVQVMLETVVYCIASLAISVILLYMLFPKVLQLLEPDLQFGMLAGSSVVILTALILLMLVISSAGFPAYWLATSNTANDLKSTHGPGHRWSLGKVLLIAQFTISAICISITLIVGRQLNYIHTKDLGFDRKDLLVMSMPEDFTVRKMQLLKEELKSITGIASVSNSSFRIGGGYWKDWYTVEVDGEMKSLELYEVFSDDDLFNTLGMKLLEGRTFDATMPADSGSAFVINETAVRELGWTDPVGKRIYTHPEDTGKWDGTVVGVVGDINISSLHQKVQPLVMRLPWQNDYPEYFVYIRINGPAAQTIQAIEKKYKAILPDYPMELDFVDAFYNNQYQKENKAFASLQFGTFIIALVSSLGIFSLSIYMSARRMREFGIRKVLGASTKQITLMHVAHFLRLAFIANVLALPASYWLMKEWLDDFAYRTEMDSTLFIVVMAISFFLVIISASYSAIKAGHINPVEVIKVS